MLNKAKIILGVDPGTLSMGYSLIAIRNNQMQVLSLNVLKLPAKTDMYERLRQIHCTMHDIIHDFKPEELAIEAPFFGKNVQSMLKLGRAQGIAIAVAMQFGIPVTEYSPRKIKKSITGNGNAGKEQVWKMLQQILIVPDKGQHYDASDALAVAVCHHFQGNSIQGEKGKKKIRDWDDFVRNYPGRIRISG